MWIAIKILLGSIPRKWIIVTIVTALLSGGGLLAWNKYKDGLRDEGRQDCINTQLLADIEELETTLRLQEEENERLARIVAAKERENARARQRQQDAEDKVTQLLSDREQQEEEDETYREWSNDDTPGGVFDRLRRLQEREAAPAADHN